MRERFTEAVSKKSIDTVTPHPGLHRYLAASLLKAGPADGCCEVEKKS